MSWDVLSIFFLPTKEIRGGFDWYSRPRTPNRPPNLIWFPQSGRALSDQTGQGHFTAGTMVRELLFWVFSHHCCCCGVKKIRLQGREHHQGSDIMRKTLTWAPSGVCRFSEMFKNIRAMLLLRGWGLLWGDPSSQLHWASNTLAEYKRHTFTKT